MKLPRDLSGDELIARLIAIGFQQTRQSGSHARLSARLNDEDVHITVPRHNSLRVGTLSGIVRELARQTGCDRNTMVERLFKR